MKGKYESEPRSLTERVYKIVCAKGLRCKHIKYQTKNNKIRYKPTFFFTPDMIANYLVCSLSHFNSNNMRKEIILKNSILHLNERF